MKIKRDILLITAGLVLVGSFFLPNMEAGVMDARRLDRIITVGAQSISISTDTVFGLPQRIALAASPNTEMLALTAGQVMGTETAKARAARELARFFRGDLFDSSADDYTVEDGVTTLVTDSGDPSVNLIMWEFRAVDRQNNEMTVTIDDETGMILKLIYQQRDGGAISGGTAGEDDSGLFSGDMNGTAQRLTEMMTAYYGLTVRLGDYQFGNGLAYYRADMYGGGQVIYMYGVVRVNGFTMNERV